MKVANDVLGSVLCSPGCFSVYRAAALRDVLPIYSSKVNNSTDFLTKDMGKLRSVGGRGRMSLCGENPLPRAFWPGACFSKALLWFKMAASQQTSPFCLVNWQLNQYVKVSKFRSVMYTQQLSGPCKNRDFRETGQQGLYSAGDAIHVYGSSLFLVFPVALKFLRLLRFSPLLKNAAYQNFSSIHLWYGGRKAVLPTYLPQSSVFGNVSANN